MSAAEPRQPIRVLVDKFHDASPHDAAEELRPAGMDATISRRRLTASLLAKYHVVIISGYAPKRFTPAELRAIEQFVAEGGGLLLATSAPRFALEVGETLSELPAQQVAELFGCRFLGADECSGTARVNRSFHEGYRPRDARIADAPDGFGPHPPTLDAWLPVEAPGAATVVMRHRRTNEALAVTVRHGKGRVCLCGEPLRRANPVAHMAPLATWLAGKAKPRAGRSVPDAIGPEAKMKRYAGMRVIYDANAEDRLGEALPLVARARDEVARIVGDEVELPELVHVVDGCEQGTGWWSRGSIGVRGAPWTIAWDATWWLLLAEFGQGQLGDALVSVFPEYTTIRFFTIEVLRRLGFEEQAERLHGMALAMYDPDDEKQSACDLARGYSATLKWHPKGYWAMDQLRQKYGFRLFERLCEIVPAKEAFTNLPGHTWSSDHAIYYMSLAAGEDLFPWFAEIGTTVHPIPIIKRDARNFKRAAAESVAAGRKGNASERIEALGALAKLEEKDRAKLPARVRELAEGIRMAGAGDANATPVLQRIIKRKPDSQDAAIAALQLVAGGEKSACRKLAALAANEDTRFKLWAGYALRKAGRDDAGLSLRAVGEVDTRVVTELQVHARVEGYEVANVVCEAGRAQFPEGNFASRFYVYWVHTSPQWRRMGLSRELFEVALNHPVARACSTFALDTGTRNVAHRMYAEFGFVDVTVEARYHKTLSEGTPCARPDGVMVREMRESERAQVRRLIADTVAARFGAWPAAAPELSPVEPTTVALADDKVVGAAVGRVGDRSEGELRALCVAPKAEQREKIGAALLTGLHGLMAKAGAREIKPHIPSENAFLDQALTDAGYARKLSGGVEMFGIRDLAQLFGEIRPLFESRVAESDFSGWRGRVRIVGERLRTGLEIADGHVQVIDASPRRGDIVVTGPDRVITRFVAGCETPMEGYLQTHATIEPAASAPVMGLLATLFPRVEIVRGQTIG